jgi:hypothetical protein
LCGSLFFSQEIPQSVAAKHYGTKVNILAYHRLGETKYKRLDRKQVAVNIVPLTAEQMAAIQKTIETHGLTVTIGGEKLPAFRHSTSLSKSPVRWKCSQVCRRFETQRRIEGIIWDFFIHGSLMPNRPELVCDLENGIRHYYWNLGPDSKEVGARSAPTSFLIS